MKPCSAFREDSGANPGSFCRPRLESATALPAKTLPASAGTAELERQTRYRAVSAAGPLRRVAPRCHAHSLTRKRPGLSQVRLLLRRPERFPRSRARPGDGASAPRAAAAAACPRAPPVLDELRPLGDAGAPRHRRLRQRHPLAQQGEAARGS